MEPVRTLLAKRLHATSTTNPRLAAPGMWENRCKIRSTQVLEIAIPPRTTLDITSFLRDFTTDLRTQLALDLLLLRFSADRLVLSVQARSPSVTASDTRKKAPKRSHSQSEATDEVKTPFSFEPEDTATVKRRRVALPSPVTFNTPITPITTFQTVTSLRDIAPCVFETLRGFWGKEAPLTAKTRTRITPAEDRVVAELPCVLGLSDG